MRRNFTITLTKNVLILITFSFVLETVGCFELPRSRSPLQKEPEAPEMIGTKFYLFRRNINFSEPEVLHYGDGGESVKKSKFNASQPLKLIIHGYMSKWNEKGALMGANAYLKIVSVYFQVLRTNKMNFL